MPVSEPDYMWCRGEPCEEAPSSRGIWEFVQTVRKRRYTVQGFALTGTVHFILIRLMMGEWNNPACLLDSTMYGYELRTWMGDKIYYGYCFLVGTDDDSVGHSLTQTSSLCVTWM